MALFLRISMVSTLLLILAMLHEQITSLKAAPPPPPLPPCSPPPSGGPGPANYILAIQWARTVCNNRPVCRQKVFKNDFTIHGIWMKPEPMECKGSAFDVTALSNNVKQQLTSDWMNAERRDDVPFWKHEYDRHGERLNFGVSEYFEMGLAAYAILKRLQLGKILMVAYGGTPSLNETKIYSELKKLLRQHDFGMTCMTDGGNYKLKELRIYFRYTQGRWNVGNLPRRFMPVQDRCVSGAAVMLPTR